MTCDELRQDYTSYALGIADDPERSEIAAHLARECPNCVPGMRQRHGDGDRDVGRRAGDEPAASIFAGA